MDVHKDVGDILLSTVKPLFLQEVIHTVTYMFSLIINGFNVLSIALFYFIVLYLHQCFAIIKSDILMIVVL